MKNDSISEYISDVEVLTTIILAIEMHSVLAIEYTKDIDSNGVREILPHNVYRSTKDNTRIMLDAYQLSGASKTGIMSFKQFDTSLIKSCIILNEKFNIQQGYNPDSVRYKDSIIGIVA